MFSLCRSKSLRFILFLVFIVLALPPSGQRALAREADNQLMFGGREFTSKGLSGPRKWTSVLERHESEMSRLAEACTTSDSRGCKLNEWQQFLTGIEDKKESVKLILVNLYVNRTAYISDADNWGVPDYWASPREFFAKGGDCEDYAIAKYLSLRALGFSSANLRIAVLWDARAQESHAVLVYTKDNLSLVLDNRNDQLLPASSLGHYQPTYSVNEISWALH
ncbi:MAG: transglutaminase-like cysteine peptidase [Proteobacteria bacterium]|nr:transglutaminase-like cysteine peptidase [Pseudomonadota bacterium]